MPSKKCEPGCICKRHALVGRPRDPAIGRKISAAKMGHEVSLEARAKISASSKGRKQTPAAIAARVAARRSHGEAGRATRSSEYRTWGGMVQRCTNPNNSRYSSYGGRGITVCDRWRTFENFLEDMGRRPSPDHSIDRIDNDGSYEPGNVRWATKSQQQINRRARAPHSAETRAKISAANKAAWERGAFANR